MILYAHSSQSLRVDKFYELLFLELKLKRFAASRIIPSQNPQHWRLFPIGDLRRLTICTVYHRLTIYQPHIVWSLLANEQTTIPHIRWFTPCYRALNNWHIATEYYAQLNATNRYFGNSSDLGEFCQLTPAGPDYICLRAPKLLKFRRIIGAGTIRQCVMIPKIWTKPNLKLFSDTKYFRYRIQYFFSI